MEKKSIFGLSENAAAALSYLLGPFSGIVVLILERESRFVRFHALQSTLWFLLLYILWWMTSWFLGIPFLGPFLGILLHPLRFVLGVVMFLTKLLLILKAHQGATFKLPIIGDVVYSQVYK